MISPSPEPTPAELRQMAWGFGPPLILETALRYGIFDLLARGSLTLDQLASETAASERGLRALLDALVALGFLLKPSTNTFDLTPMSRTLLVSSRPDFQGGILKQISARIAIWLHLEEAIRTGCPITPLNRKEPGAEYFSRSVMDLFALNYPAAQVFSRSLGLGKADKPVRVLDVAAGSAVWSIAMAKASKQVQVTAVDWNEVLPITKEMVTRWGVSDQFLFLSGDAQIADFGTGYSIAVLGHLLHSEGERKSKLLLQRVFEALAMGGTIAIAEFLVNRERTGPILSMLFGVSMLLNTEEGDVFSFEQIADWLVHVGFAEPRLLAVPGPSPLIIATRK
jgi:hypothetical protein